MPSWKEDLESLLSKSTQPTPATTDEDWLGTHNSIAGSKYIFYSENSVDTGKSKATSIAHPASPSDLPTLMRQIETGLAESYDDPTKREEWKTAVKAAYDLSKENMPKIASQLSEASPAMHLYGILSKTPDSRSQGPSVFKERVEASIGKAMEQWQVECEKNPEAGPEAYLDSAGSC